MGTSELSAKHRRYLRNEILVGCVFNAILSVLFAWIIFRGVGLIPLWGAQGLAVDLIPTVFMITLVGSIIMTFATRSRVRNGKVIAVGEPWASHWSIRWLPRNAFARALVVALLATAVLVPISVGVLAALNVTNMAFNPFVGFKVIYGVVVGILSAPFVLLAALTDTGRGHGTAGPSVVSKASR